MAHLGFGLRPTIGTSARPGSSLKERGRVKGLALVTSSLLRHVVGRTRLRRRGQGSARQGRPRSGRRSLTPAPPGARCSVRRRGKRVLLFRWNVVDSCR